MNRIQFGEGACESARQHLDSYISLQLPGETNHQVQRHLDTCPACAAEAQARTRLRGRLKAAVNAQSVPPELQVRIRQQLQANRSNAWSFAAGWPRWAGPMAATLLVSVGLWSNYSREKMPALTDRPAQNAYIQRVSATLSAVLKVGLGDHIHCSIFRKYPTTPPPVAKMEADLGPSYKGLLPVVRAAVPEGYRVVMAHQCSYSGRKFIHFTFEKDGELLSLVIAHRNGGESMDGLSPASQVSRLPIYQSGAGRYEVAGFEAGNFLAYVVSEMKGKTNLQVAASLAPAVHEYLMKNPA